MPETRMNLRLRKRPEFYLPAEFCTVLNETGICDRMLILQHISEKSPCVMYCL